MTLILKNIAYYFGGRPLFSSITSCLEEGEALEIRGPNGSGKSLLMRIIAGFLPPDEGRVCWNFHPIVHCMEKIFYLGHDLPLSESLSLYEDIALRIALLGGEGDDAMRALSNLNMASMSNSPCYTLSKGWKQRAALAVMMCIERPLWLLDEPFSGIDQDGQKCFLSLCSKHLKRGGNIIIATHRDTQLSVHKPLFLKGRS